MCVVYIVCLCMYLCVVSVCLFGRVYYCVDVIGRMCDCVFVCLFEVVYGARVWFMIRLINAVIYN